MKKIYKLFILIMILSISCFSVYLNAFATDEIPSVEGTLPITEETLPVEETTPPETLPEETTPLETEPETEVSTDNSYYDFGQTEEATETSSYITYDTQVQAAPDVTQPEYSDQESVDTDELDENDWEEALDFNNAVPINESGGDSFEFIKNNKSTEDSGNTWMVVTGYALIIVSIIGIAFTVMLCARKKKIVSIMEARRKAQRASIRNEKRQNNYDDNY